MTDNEFRAFVASLKTCEEDRFSSSRSAVNRSNSSVLDIARTAIGFLKCVAESTSDPGLIGPGGRINIVEHRSVRMPRKKGGNPKVSMHWTHSCLPKPSAKKSRKPISSSDIEKLREATVRVSTSSFLRKRRLVMLRLLEMTGARRGEIELLCCRDIYAAAAMRDPMLRLKTLKSDQNAAREVPVSASDLRLIIEYIEKNRRPLLANLGVAAQDENHLLISATTGKGLKANTITNEIGFIAKAANLETQCCPHLFRHRFITKAVQLIVDRNITQNRSAFRRTIMDSGTLLVHLMQWTGHKDRESFAGYIDLGFDEGPSAVDRNAAARLRLAVESTLRQVKTLMMELPKDGITGSKSSVLLEVVGTLHRELVDAMSAD
ncbi:tyrosine-type recombinase/integrase [Stenotrophomonas sp. NRRL B-14846]|uniref:tyrosine-type recombinase/integrase n=1 Tax=Stenotrophomonas sp. NRRL B-14846 TaxID=3162882 RepID=UPI003D28E02D